MKRYLRQMLFGLGILSMALLLAKGHGTIQRPLLRFSLVLFATTASVILILRAARAMTLRDRKVGRRLLVLLAFATLVPTLLVGAMWAISSWLGSASDRALAAAREYGAEAAHLEDELTVALGEPGNAEARLRDIATVHGRRGEALTIWLHRAAWQRIAGDAAVNDTALAALPANLADTATLVTVDGASYVAAAASAPDSSVTALGLLPARNALAREISKRVGAELEFNGAPGDTVTFTPTGLHADGHGVLRALDEVNISPFRGFAARDGWLWQGGRWTPVNHMIAVRLDFLPSLGGMIRNAMVTPVASVPLVLLVLFFIVGVRVLVVNGQTLRAIGRSITGAVGALRGGVEALEAGRLGHRIEIAGNDELWDVAAGFNQAAEGLERARKLELERERLENELQIARRIQARLLPAAPPDAPGLEIAGLSLPALEVGGDYYDHVALGDGRVALVVADVSGKGVPAALLMSGFRASLLGQLDAHADPARVMANVNRFLHRSVEPGRFVTAFLAIVDGRNGAIEYVNAGHNTPFLVPPSGAPVALETGGLLLAMLEDAAYEHGAATLERGTTLVIYSDGAVEARAPDGAMWGEERLIGQVRDTASRPCADAAQRIAEQVRVFEGAQGPSDDLTLVLARRRGAS
ncbi:MAG: PP2C family protein-serine/threonine phosphatase [Hyphomicrobiales bacterium]